MGKKGGLRINRLFAGNARSISTGKCSWDEYGEYERLYRVSGVNDRGCRRSSCERVEMGPADLAVANVRVSRADRPGGGVGGRRVLAK